jgi:MFS family permease
MLFLSVGLATPFYSIHVAVTYQSDVQNLSIFVVASAVTTMFSGAIWSKLLTRDPRRVLALAGWLAAAAGAVAVIEAVFVSLTMQVMYVGVFSLIQLAVQGMSQSCNAYLTLKAPEQYRPRMLAINNALLGGMAVFVSIFVGVIAHTAHIYVAFGALIGLAIWASIRATKLEPVEIYLSDIKTEDDDHDG